MPGNDACHILKPAALKLRAVAAAIDFVAFGAVSYAYIRYFGYATNDGYAVNGCGHFLVLFTAWLLWFPIPEAVRGQTVGKWACDLRVVNVSDGPVTFSQAFVRHLLDFVDISFLGLVGILVSRSTALNQRVGDLVARTKVIDDPERAE